jgi:hypothetical protein
MLMPLFCLNDIKLLDNVKGYTIGTTNLLILQMEKLKPDACYDIDKNELKINSKELKLPLKATNYETKLVKKMLNVEVWCESRV